MKIEYDRFKPMNNWVLVKPDENHEFYQRKGKNTGIVSPDHIYENGKIINVKERNASVTGTVYGVCDEIRFFLDKITNLRKNHTTHRPFWIDGTKKNVCINPSIQRIIDTYYRSSSNFFTEVEIQKGDRVNFSYMAHARCLQDGRAFETELGVMYLIKYDQLYYTIDEKEEPIKMLNGFIVVEPEEVETYSIDLEGKIIEGIQTESGIVIPNPKKIKKKRKYQIGTVRYFGNSCKGYLQEPEAKDHDGVLEKGMRILYDPRGATTMEYENHQTFSNKCLWLLQRKDIWFIDKEIELNLVNFV